LRGGASAHEPRCPLHRNRKRGVQPGLTLAEFQSTSSTVTLECRCVQCPHLRDNSMHLVRLRSPTGPQMLERSQENECLGTSHRLTFKANKCRNRVESMSLSLYIFRIHINTLRSPRSSSLPRSPSASPNSGSMNISLLRMISLTPSIFAVLVTGQHFGD